MGDKGEFKIIEQKKAPDGTFPSGKHFHPPRHPGRFDLPEKISWSSPKRTGAPGRINRRRTGKGDSQWGICTGPKGTG